MKYKVISLSMIAAALIAFFVFLNNFGENKVNSLQVKDKVLAEKEIARVLRAVDGDTIEVSLNGKKETIRLIGVDSPEVVDERKPVQCFGKEASDKAKEVLTGKTVILESDPTQGERDEYNRLLRYVFLEDGINFDKSMIDQGFAREYTFKDSHYKYQSEFIQAEEKARENNHGLWQKCGGV